MPTLLPRDDNNTPIPAMRLVSGGAHKINFNATSARNTTAFNATTRVISIFTTRDVYVKTGNSSVTATTSDHFIPANLYYALCLGSDASDRHTHIAALRATEDGTLYISEQE